MRIDTCYCCSGPCYPGHGITFVRNDAKVRAHGPSLPCTHAALNATALCVQVFRFCRSKCHNTFKNKYNPRKLKWTKAFRRAAGKEMAVDSTFDFERLRNRPVKYDRELMKKTVRTMERVQAIKEKREERFWAKRMAPNKEVQKARDLAEVEPSRTRRMRELLVEWLTSARESGWNEGSAVIDSAEAAALEGLGYADEARDSTDNDWIDPECECEMCEHYREE